MEKPILVVMAAGMASRYGGAKQVDPVDENGCVILDYSVFDAMRAGFDEVVFIIRESLKRDFEEDICPRMQSKMKTHLAFQRLTDIPQGFSVPEGREKPWGTTHAVLSAKEFLNRPFAVINADDFYGLGAYKTIYNFLTANSDPNNHAMAGYLVENTLSDNGTVTRGVCTAKDGKLTNCTETYGLYPTGGGAKDKNGDFFPNGTFISMNFWGFKPSIVPALERDLVKFMQTEVPSNPLKSECLLPNTPSGLIASGEASFDVLPVHEVWSGVTYKEDMPGVKARIASLRADGSYPMSLWG